MTVFSWGTPKCSCKKILACRSRIRIVICNDDDKHTNDNDIGDLTCIYSITQVIYMGLAYLPTCTKQNIPFM